ncbi:MAG TPA: HlyD family secretion protein [Thermoanaerobaculia bacterium]|nr:HlyD family secretion protein [Thermoanaerobaculia bacterium]
MPTTAESGREEQPTGAARSEPTAKGPQGLRQRLWGNRRTRGLFLAGIAVAFVVLAVSWYYFSTHETTDDAQIDGHIVAIAPRVGGMVTTVHVNDNQTVKKGDLLVEIDPEDYQIALERAQAEYAAAEGALSAAEAGVPITSQSTASGLSTADAQLASVRSAYRSAAKEVAAAEARLEAARARAKQASDDLARMKKLIAKQEISQQQYDAAQSQATTAAAAVSEAEQGVAIAEGHQQQAASAVASAQAAVSKARTGPQEVTVSKAQQTSAEARVKQAKAALDQAKLNLQRTKITAPMDGVVSKKSVEVGELVRSDQPLMALVPLSDIWVTANFKETELKNMRPGQRARISVDAYDRTYRGHVESIAPATGAKFSLLPPENASGNYVKVVQRVPVKIVLDKGQDPERLLRPGMSVEATVITH